MTPAEHQQIEEVNQLWRNMNSSTNGEKAKADLADTGKGKPKDIEAAKEAAHLQWLLDWSVANEPPTLNVFSAGFDAAVAYLSEPNALRFLANESITKENDALKKRIAELEAK